ncbi:ferredoxin-thioredoxin reductase variable chain [Calothrix sp. PCC 6303]|uniref:ferredoxin-thioredoxin reductase variable chain n=1 Tax=Calothrix sp. PCC 6303 TaxID=1170562 RepID=UPI0002A005C4|nr:ferredoxin-thioredoxin reductase variable chain [Calothrix sp. PCC 6303]AFY99658.1 ferredoxin thioredoxin reductase alpha chain [Calothrix sp. PCC 6303]
MGVETLVQEQKLGLKGDMKAGDRIRVKESVIIYHHPGHRGQGFDLKDIEGEVVDIVTQWHGRPVSANFPILVQFPQIGKKFRAHLRENELEII